MARAGNFAKSVKEYKAALVIKPSSLVAHLGLGNAYYELDTNDAALVHLEKARAIAPRDAQVHLLLGAVYQSSGRKEDAITAYKRYLEIAPEGKYARDVKGILKGLGVE
jgi:protein O-mannosyl-transferase